MKDRTPEQLKGQIRSFAEKCNLQSQEVFQMFLLERVLDRLSRSKYNVNFILKGGLLISSMIGVTERTTKSVVKYMTENISEIRRDTDLLAKTQKKLATYISLLDNSSKLLFATTITNARSERGISLYNYVGR